MKKEVTYSEFLEIDRNSKEQLELIDGNIYSLSTPTVLHQKVVTNLSTEFGNYFRGKECRHFVAPLDVVLKDKDKTHKVQPDLTVICDKQGLGSQNYQGLPTLVVEVLSPSTASVDLINKMEIYMKLGVSECWIISPRNKTIQISSLNKDGEYSEPITYFEDGIVNSIIFKDLTIKLSDIFE